MANAKVNLVIVESPAKSKTIGKYLGSDYKVMASMGHLRDLPKSVMGVDLSSFEPDYQPVKGREDMISELSRAAKNAKNVYLATDPDREGEAISWHLKELLKLRDENTYRVTFNEITKKVVTESIAHPRAIDNDLVDAQQARRILDRIVGYKLSPLLWKKIKRGLSAGRVQSVATRLVTDREAEIEAFTPEEYWLLSLMLSKKGEKTTFEAKFFGENGKKRELSSAAEVDEVLSAVKSSEVIVAGVKRTDKKKSPAPPFITSTLQQEASRRLGMTPRRTMSIAQQLYEGVELQGEGTVGLITYMRTDSLRISDEALASTQKFIVGRYGEEYHPGTPRRFKTKSGAQDAHEAIRPSDVFLTPESIKASLTSDQYKLYRLIWGRFVASQMAAAVYDTVTADIEADKYNFKVSRSVIKFSGYTAVYEEATDEEAEPVHGRLPNFTEGDVLDVKDTSTEQKFTQPPTRYTEATLIKEMEDTGIGRPSTYAPTISTILDREYVVKEGKYLKPTPLGTVVTNLMKERFPDIVDLKFTANMEEKLDDVEHGNKNWKELLGEFYTPFNTALESAEKALEGERIRVPAEVTEEKCPVCGKNLVIKSGRFGRFLACPGFPECTFTSPLIIEMPGKCPNCGSRILKRTSRKGYTFYACERGADCGFMSWDVPTKDVCPECGHTMFKRAGRGFNKSFCINEKCPNFLPEDKRGYKRKKTDAGEEKAAPAEKKTAGAKKTAAKKTDSGKTPAKKKTVGKEK